jgi:hypothetical protein
VRSTIDAPPVQGRACWLASTDLRTGELAPLLMLDEPAEDVADVG